MHLSSKPNFFQLLILICGLFLLQACGDNNNPFSVTYNPPPPYNLTSADTTIVTEKGLKVYVIEKGDSPFQVTGRDQIRAYYTGRIIENGQIGRVFDSTYRNGVETPSLLQNLTSTAVTNPRGGTQSPLIEGFRLAIVGKKVGGETIIPPMHEGGKRVVVIPPSLGYGDARKGTGGYDLRNDTLRFDIQLAEIL